MRSGLSSNTCIIIFAIMTIFCGAFTAYHSPESQFVNAQIQHSNGTQSLLAQNLTEPMGVKINSPVAGQEVPVGMLNISGTSTDNVAKDCHVFVDVNDVKPLQKTRAVGPGGENDYSNWTFTYTDDYHLISEGPNELTAKLSCSENPENNSGIGSALISNSSNGRSKWYSINVTGIALPSSVEGDQTGNQSQIQSANDSKQNATISEKPQDNPSDSVPEPMPPNSINKQEIAAIPEEELSAPEEEGSSHQILQSNDKSSEEEVEVEGVDVEKVEEVEEELDSSQILTESDNINEESEHVATDTVSPHGPSTVGSPNHYYGPQPFESSDREEFQQPAPMSDLPKPNPDDAGTQLREEVQDIDADDADYWLVPTEEQTSQEEDDQEYRVEEKHSANEMFEMITEGVEEQPDTDKTGADITKPAQNIHDQDPEDKMAEEISLMQSYTRDIESALE
ncbi:MAG: hypothetical protein M3297_13605 [Thermoproteota archaeon]|nr:hypothetical protein [Thermoproteota archaeon]